MAGPVVLAVLAQMLTASLPLEAGFATAVS